MDNKDKGKNGLLKFALMFLIVIFIIIAGAYIFYFFTKENIVEYVPKDYLGYIKIDSLSKFYNNIIDLKAADIALSQKEYQSIYKFMQDFRKSKFTKNRLVSAILNMKVNVVMKNNYSTVLLFDLGFKSIISRSTEFFIKFIGNQKNFKIEPVKRINKDYTIYKFLIEAQSQTIYFTIYKNLLFVSFKEADINLLFETKKNKSNIKDDSQFNFVRSKVKKKGMAEVFLNTQMLINMYGNNIYQLRNILDKFSFYSNTAVTFEVSNEDIFLNSSSLYHTEDPLLSDFVENNGGSLGVINYLPDDTNLLSAVNVKSFEEFYKVFLYLDQGRFDETIKKIDNASKLFFKIGIKELIFSWVGSEIGVFTMNVSNRPVVFLKIKNKKNFDNVIETLVNSIVFQEDKKIIYDGVELMRIKFPDFLQSIFDLFIKGIDTPYYITKDDYIFLSMDPENLSNIVNKYENQLTLEKDKIYRDISAKVENRANIFLYFNMSKNTPDFLKSKNQLSDIIKLYEKGIMTINFRNLNLNIDIACSGINVKKAVLFPGYPKKIEAGIASPVVCENITGSNVDEIFYITKNKDFVICDINNQPLKNFPVELNGAGSESPIITDLDYDGEKEIYIYTDKRILHRFNKEGYETSPYPVSLDIKIAFNPLIYGNSLVFYSENKNKMFFIKEANKEDFNFNFKSPLISPPAIDGKIFAFYPKSFSGEIYLTDEKGVVINGWPRETSGIGYGSPVISELSTGGVKKVLFITQSGNLNVWNLNGNPDENFPIKLNGDYYTQAVGGAITGNWNKEIVILSEDGTLSLISNKGTILLQKQVKEAGGKNRRILLFDINRDGKQEIFIYGDSNNILALNKDFNILPGFPVKGNTKPVFSDFDSDGVYELVSGGVDDYLYVYSVP